MVNDKFALEELIYSSDPTSMTILLLADDAVTRAGRVSSSAPISSVRHSVISARIGSPADRPILGLGLEPHDSSRA